MDAPPRCRLRRPTRLGCSRTLPTSRCAAPCASWGCAGRRRRWRTPRPRATPTLLSTEQLMVMVVVVVLEVVLGLRRGWYERPGGVPWWVGGNVLKVQGGGMDGRSVVCGGGGGSDVTRASDGSSPYASSWGASCLCAGVAARQARFRRGGLVGRGGGKDGALVIQKRWTKGRRSWWTCTPCMVGLRDAWSDCEIALRLGASTSGCSHATP